MTTACAERAPERQTVTTGRSRAISLTRAELPERDQSCARDVPQRAGVFPGLAHVDDLHLFRDFFQLETRVDSFKHWMAGRRAVPLLRALDERAERLRAAELERARRMLARGEPAEAVLVALATGLSNKILHGPRTLLGRGTLAPDEAQRLAEQWLPARAGRDIERIRQFAPANDAMTAPQRDERIPDCAMAA